MSSGNSALSRICHDLWPACSALKALNVLYGESEVFSSGILNMGMVDADLDFLHKSVAFEKPVECDGRLRATALVLPLGLALCVRSGANYRLLYCAWLGLVCLRFFPPSTWLGLAHSGYFLSLCIGCTVSITPWLPIHNENKFQLIMFCNTTVCPSGISVVFHVDCIMCLRAFSTLLF